MKIITPKNLSGFMELPPKEQVLFEKIKQKLEETYRLFGFYPIDTPVLERSEILLAKTGGDTEKQIYRFSKGDTDMAMRFDLTVPLAKYVAKNYSELTFPFKRYQIGKVYRGERAQQGRFREFYQADIDIIGDGDLSVVNDAEVPSIMYFNSFEGVFNAVEKGLCQYGILPIENSSAGSVTQVYDLMEKHKFHIVRAARERIEHKLMALPGTRLKK